MNSTAPEAVIKSFVRDLETKIPQPGDYIKLDCRGQYGMGERA